MVRPPIAMEVALHVLLPVAVGAVNERPSGSRVTTHALHHSLYSRRNRSEQPHMQCVWSLREYALRAMSDDDERCRHAVFLNDLARRLSDRIMARRIADRK